MSSKSRIGGDTAWLALLDATVDAVIVINHHGNIELINRSGLEMFGYQESELIGRNVNMLMPEPYRSEHDQYMQHYAQTAEARIIGIGRDVAAKRSDGSEFPIHLSVGVVQDDKQNRFVGIIRDITKSKHDADERMRIQRQLENSEQILRLTIEHAPTPILTLDASGIINTVNPRACLMLDRSKDVLVGTSLASYVSEHDRGAFSRLFAGELPPTGDTDTLSGNVNLISSIQGAKSAKYNINVAHDTRGKIVNYVVALEDLSERLRAERWEKEHRERLAHGDRLNLLGEMAAGIAHEINQPLTVITARTNAARRRVTSGVADVAKLVDTLDRINAQAHRAAEVIRRLRLLAKRDMGEAEYADLNAVVNDTVGLAKVDARLQGVRLDIHFAAQPQPVHVDIVQIQQVILNLVRNAIDATVAATVTQFPVELRVRTATSDDTSKHYSGSDHDVDKFVVIDVIDRGSGVREEIRDQLFEAFFTTKSSGMGMGLSVSQSIVRAHDGSLIYRDNPQGGAIFSLALPLAVKRQN